MLTLQSLPEFAGSGGVVRTYGHIIGPILVAVSIWFLSEYGRARIGNRQGGNSSPFLSAIRGMFYGWRLFVLDIIAAVTLFLSFLRPEYLVEVVGAIYQFDAIVWSNVAFIGAVFAGDFNISLAVGVAVLAGLVAFSVRAFSGSA